jgi:hypothetical protein
LFICLFVYLFFYCVVDGNETISNENDDNGKGKGKLENNGKGKGRSKWKLVTDYKNVEQLHGKV